MDKEARTRRLAELVALAGSQRKAEALIKSIRGASPSKSAIDRAVKGSCTEYQAVCMIDDLTAALKLKVNSK
ncbi:hypothetical protein QXB71_003563 [Vibrio cholerae]|uniref:Uncharacterized protein n=1 Tax=Vibrio cholerae TaxID=666 RepID=A0ABD7SR08_VIBCL|nr:hypothetical protein [Vibrio cholerae]HAU9839367.1 hypothetical protein [Vibrio cholerae O1]EGR4075090.1 hypothetical protein [Vibrio cholerae]ELO1828307.1 hypothetical protein [Vibrio cholerae]TXX67230.1 hypothetical protein FXF03_01265 [Vibrio cholerae]TXY43995.1 hypothetical protein FXE84_01265 [Vibrio cholerae]